jgi:hypothetical protein
LERLTIADKSLILSRTKKKYSCNDLEKIACYVDKENINKEDLISKVLEITNLIDSLRFAK